MSNKKLKRVYCGSNFAHELGDSLSEARPSTSSSRPQTGFNVSSTRFTPLVAQTPGPGGYNLNTPANYRPESVGKKGYGGLVSNASRFSGPALPCYSGPGPGSYASENIRQEPRAANRPSAAFQSKTPIAQPTVNSGTDVSTPGPGAYQVAETNTGEKMNWLQRAGNVGHQSVFKAAPREDARRARPVTQPAATVHLDLREPRPCSCEPRRQAGTSSSRAGSPSPSLMAASINRRLSTLLYAGAARMPSKTAPGPGAYEPDQFTSLSADLQRLASRPCLSVFNSGAPRFHKNVESPAPGPGQYSPAPTATSRSAVSSPFLSKSPGHAEALMSSLSSVPGPGTYKPVQLGKKSYNVLAQQEK